jgi:site-specific recombinase XerD
MAIYKRGKYYWYSFIFNGERIQESTKQAKRSAARDIQAAMRTALAKGEVGIVERKPVPTLRAFGQRFVEYITVRCAVKPHTVSFYAKKLARLLEFEPLASARLNKIDEALIESYVQDRRSQVSPASVNRELATLRRLMRMAQEWKVIERVPRIRLLPGERCREFVLGYTEESDYLNAAPLVLRDVAVLILDTGLRIGEVLALQWVDVRLEPANGARFGFLQIRSGKSKNAKRNIPLTERVSAMLMRRRGENSNVWPNAVQVIGNNAAKPWVFVSRRGGSLSVDTLDKMHFGLRASLKLSRDFVLHSLRHTMLTRLGESGADAFTIMRVAGHSTVVVSQRYIHPSPESVERAFERLEVLNVKRCGKAVKQPKAPSPTTLSATMIPVGDTSLE